MIKKFIAICVSFLIVGCSHYAPSVKELDTMHKKVAYAYAQAEAMVAAANNLVEVGVLVKGTENFNKVDNLIGEMYDTLAAMEQATNLTDLVLNERNMRSTLTALRLLLVQTLKEHEKNGGEHVNYYSANKYLTSY